MNKLLILTGPSCSGKTTLEKLIIDKFNYKPVQIYGTREKRDTDINYKQINESDLILMDKDYIFKAGNNNIYAYKLDRNSDQIVSFINSKEAFELLERVKYDYNIFMFNIKTSKENIIECLKDRGYAKEEIEYRLSLTDKNKGIDRNILYNLLFFI